VLLNSTADLDAPSGPLAGRHQSIQSIVLRHEGSGWKVASFHNTLRGETLEAGTETTRSRNRE
jgi:hypothetical protein